MERSSSLQRLRAALFASRLDGLITVVLLAALLAGGQALLHWLVFKAQWAVIQANSTLFAIGRYPLDQQWRLWLLSVLLAAATGLRRFFLFRPPRMSAAMRRESSSCRCFRSTRSLSSRSVWRRAMVRASSVDS